MVAEVAEVELVLMVEMVDLELSSLHIQILLRTLHQLALA